MTPDEAKALAAYENRPGVCPVHHSPDPCEYCRRYLTVAGPNGLETVDLDAMPPAHREFVLMLHAAVREARAAATDAEQRAQAAEQRAEIAEAVAEMAASDRDEALANEMAADEALARVRELADEWAAGRAPAAAAQLRRALDGGQQEAT